MRHVSSYPLYIDKSLICLKLPHAGCLRQCLNEYQIYNTMCLKQPTSGQLGTKFKYNKKNLKSFSPG